MKYSSISRERLTALALAGAYLFALLASWRHLAGTFATLERPGDWYVGAGAAVAVDVGLAALALALASEARRGRPTRWLWLAVALFAAISALANLDHAVGVALGHAPTWADVTGGELDRLTLARAVVFSAALPLLVMVLARVVDRLAAADVGAHDAAPMGTHHGRPEPWAPTGGSSEARAPTAPELGAHEPAQRAPTARGNGRPRAAGEAPPTAGERAALLGAVARQPAASYVDLAADVGRPRSTVQRWAAAMLAAGELDGGPGGWRVPGGAAER